MLTIGLLLRVHTTLNLSAKHVLWEPTLWEQYLFGSATYQIFCVHGKELYH